jgi:hypothetical protein
MDEGELLNHFYPSNWVRTHLTTAGIRTIHRLRRRRCRANSPRLEQSTVPPDREMQRIFPPHAALESSLVCTVIYNISYTVQLQLYLIRLHMPPYPHARQQRPRTPFPSPTPTIAIDWHQRPRQTRLPKPPTLVPDPIPRRAHGCSQCLAPSCAHPCFSIWCRRIWCRPLGVLGVRSVQPASSAPRPACCPCRGACRGTWVRGTCGGWIAVECCYVLYVPRYVGGRGAVGGRRFAGNAGLRGREGGLLSWRSLGSR